MDPRIVAIFTAAGVVAGFLLKWALPPTRGVVAGEVRRLEEEYQRALRDVERSRSTPGTDDDVAADNHARAVKKALRLQQQLKDALDAFPVGA